MAKTQSDLMKAKQKRQKMIAAGGGVLLLALLGFQVPRVMKQLHKKAPVSAPAPATTTTVAATPAAATLSPASSLATAQVTAADGQLTSFSRFASKDPFQQQIRDTSLSNGEVGGSGSSSSAGSGSAPKSGSTGGGTASARGTGGSTRDGGSSAGSGSTRRETTKAVISVNGTLTPVATGAEFPQPSAADPGAVPLFRLVSQTATTAKIAIVGGSYSDGAVTITLRLNKPVTLMNTADGTRYRLVLKPRGTAVPKQD
jgi:hypothetical protein